MESKKEVVPFQPGNKVYTLTPKFITDLQKYIRKVKLKWYKKQKVKQYKTSHKRYYHMSFKIHVDDELNHQESDISYEMVVPAQAAFFAKILLEDSIKKKIRVEVMDWDEMTEEEHEEFMQSQQEYYLQEKIRDKKKRDAKRAG